MEILLVSKLVKTDASWEIRPKQLASLFAREKIRKHKAETAPSEVRQKNLKHLPQKLSSQRTLDLTGLNCGAIYAIGPS